MNLFAEHVTLCSRIVGKTFNSNCTPILVDSDCEEGPNRKVSASRKRRLSICLPDDDDRAEEVSICFYTLINIIQPPLASSVVTQFNVFSEGGSNRFNRLQWHQ